MIRDRFVSLAHPVERRILLVLVVGEDADAFDGRAHGGGGAT